MAEKYAFCKTLGVSPREYYDTSIEDVQDILIMAKVQAKLEEEELDKVKRKTRSKSKW
jgi:hypothetical protein